MDTKRRPASKQSAPDMAVPSRTQPLGWLTLLLVAAYIGTGKLSLWLAIPPGYASAIFTPAGIAVAASFMGGKRTLPGILLGSLLLNVWIGYESSDRLTVLGLSAACLIALASTLQAGVGGWCLRKAVAYPAPFDSAREVLFFLFLSPVICLVSATLSVSCLVALGVIPAGSFAMSWFVWWIGDMLGVLVMLPLALVVAGEPRALWRKRAMTVAVPMLAACALLVALFINVSRWEEGDSLMEFRVQSQRLANNFHHRLEEQASLLEQTEGLFVNGGNITREKFRRFTQKALQRFPMIQAIDWAPRVEASQRQAFEAAQGRDVPGFEIRELGDGHGFRRARGRDYFYPVTFTEPWIGNQAVSGFDLASLPDRREAIGKTTRTGSVIASVPLRLVLAQQGGLLLLLNVKTGDGLGGVVLVVLHVADFMEKLLPGSQALLCVRLIDTDARRTLYNSFFMPDGAALFQQRVSFGGRHYLLETAPKPSYLAQHRGWQGWVVLAAGTLGIGLLGALLMLASGHTARVETQVKERTEALKESEARILEIASALAEGVYVLDEDGRIIFTNPEACRLLGRAEHEMLGQKAHSLFHYMHADGSPLLPEASEMLKVLRSGRLHRGEETFWRKDGRPLPVEASASPIVREGQRIGAVVAFSDISERKRLEATLQREATYDALTDLPNRRLFMDRLQQAIDRAQRNDKAGAVLFMDLDGFKQINDAYGHDVGDQILQLFAQRLQASVRKTDTVARLAGDEFTIILEGLKEPFKEAEALAKKIVANVSVPAIVSTHAVSISTSIGIAIFTPTQNLSPDAVLSGADAAMYRAKMAGKNCVACKG
ncbi:diguanylate cyclase domain-containing protein [Crenobacter cavernae]|nr:diguanylate cyclase [Crenobacter cavernae]